MWRRQCITHFHFMVSSTWCERHVYGRLRIWLSCLYRSKSLDAVQSKCVLHNNGIVFENISQHKFVPQFAVCHRLENTLRKLLIQNSVQFIWIDLFAPNIADYRINLIFFSIPAIYFCHCSILCTTMKWWNIFYYFFFFKFELSAEE